MTKNYLAKHYLARVSVALGAAVLLYLALTLAGVAVHGQEAPVPEAVNFVWTDNSTNEDGFIFEARRASDGLWIELARTPANVAAYTLTDPAPYTGARVWAYAIDSWTGAELRSDGSADNLRPAIPDPATGLQPVAVVSTTRATTTSVAYYAAAQAP